ncbi:hypothetical protein DSL72_007829 [Monilinia vaccinii-corymbosi]|uniref:3-hydroxyisobutyrate dehydrogenase protein n=1 Tax=Monilinia vaccinii-corymbosi TaxID=61207 RepID=A0A8A3PI11_9HELO|nr:hypothetical protein DSL72_007829 [Monilinia vaccinii-corymbosi]
MSTSVDINHQFDGQWHWFKLLRYKNPKLADEERIEPAPTYFHRDILNRQTWRPRDLLRYISPFYGKPYHMIVQAASGPNTQPQGEWRRRRVSGNAPLLLRVSSWAIGNQVESAEDFALAFGRSILVLPIITFVVAYPMFTFGSGRDSEKYTRFPHKCYEYPKHALNQLDAAPNASQWIKGQREDDGDKIYVTKGEQSRLLRPRALVVFRDNEWKVVEDGSFSGPYIFISFAAAQYQKSAPTDQNPGRTELDKDAIDTRARKLTLHHGMEAYWADFHCRAELQPEATDDVHRFCDVTRGAEMVCVVLPDRSPQALVFFGQRLWCLPEILLARDHKVSLCTPSKDGVDRIERVDIMEFTHRSWARMLTPSNEIIHDGNDEIFRLLAEHYTGSLILTRLELIQVALKALKSRQFTEFQRGDIAYALMTLLTKRPRMDPSDTEEQALARLSLSNDSDQIVERMVCMDGVRLKGKPAWFNLDDDLGANMWDIQPLCQLAGVCHDGSLILDGAHAISIRWKDIPRICSTRRLSWKKLGADYSLRSGPFWLIVGIACVASRQLALGAFFLVFAIILLLIAPLSIKVLHGGKVWGASPWLIGFEGTLPIEEIEHLTFGNAIGRLQYTPSSGPYCTGKSDERIGAEPQLNAADLPLGHRLFTLIDTGTLTVTVFSAERPPSVALLAGKEGGMLRTILCSYERSTNGLRKECVLRMETPMWDLSNAIGWVKLT